MLKIKKTVSAFILSSLTLLLITACAELDSSSAVNRLQSSEDLYLASMRWGEWTNVLQLIRARPENPDSERLTNKESSTGEESSTYKKSSTNKKSATKNEVSYHELLSHLETFKVTHTEVLSSSMNEAEGIGESLVIIDYRLDTSVKINSIRYTVSWWQDEKSNAWFTDTPLPKEFDLPKHKTIKLSPKRY